MDTITVAAGIDQDNVVTLYDASGSLVTTYTLADTPQAAVWTGGTYATVFSPTVAWISAAAGTLRLTIPGAATAGLTPERYRIRVFIATADARVIDAWEGWLDLKPSPGTATAPKVYCTYSDLLRYAPWLDGELGDQDTSGFADHRHLARTWLETVIQHHFPWQGNFWGVDQFGFATQPALAGYGHSPQLQAWLDADLLIANDLVVEICAKRALGLILQSAIAPSKDGSPYQAAAGRFLHEADSLVKGLVAEVSVNNDGVTSFMITCSTISTRV